MKFNLKEARKFGWEGLRGWAYNSKEDFANASAAYFEVTGRHGFIKNTVSDRIYFVLDGEGEFTVQDEKILVGKDDVIIIPKNTPYDYMAKKGVLRLFLVHAPAFDQSKDISLEQNRF